MDQGLGQDRDRKLLNLIVRKTTLFTNTHTFPLSIHSRLLFRGRVTPHQNARSFPELEKRPVRCSNFIGNSSPNLLLSLDLRVNLKSTLPFYKDVKEGKRDRGDGGILDQGRRVSQRQISHCKNSVFLISFRRFTCSSDVVFDLVAPAIMPEARFNRRSRADCTATEDVRPI
jgi:hypothetical protein